MKKKLTFLLLIALAGCQSPGTSVSQLMMQKDEEMILRQTIAQMGRENNDLHKTVYRLQNVIDNQEEELEQLREE